MLFPSTFYAGQLLTLEVGHLKRSYTQDDLLHHPQLILLKNIVLPAYPNKTFHVKAIRICDLLENDKSFKRKTLLKVEAFDRYIAYIDLPRIYPCGLKHKSTAYLAIEEPDKPWPIINKLQHSAGPFYLIWQGKKVAQTDWVFGVKSIKTESVNPFNQLLPPKSTALQAQGLKVFSTYCGVCHSINLIGNLNIGPDLNFPQNPTEYFRERSLRQFIRDPQSVRYMKNDKMPAFTEEILSKQELDSLIAFLKLMSQHKMKKLHPQP